MNAVPELVLASTSPYRRELLQRLGLPFTTAAPGVDEAAVKRQLGEPRAVVQELARRKALAVAARYPDAVVVGSDQAATIDGAVLDKPGTSANACAQLLRLQGREHQLLTAVAIAHRDRLSEHVDTTRLHMRSLSPAAIERYVAAEQPLDCAGSYRIEARGITLFARVDAVDWTAIQGLPLLWVAATLRQLGLPLP